MAIYKGTDLLATRCDCCYYNINATTANVTTDCVTIENVVTMNVGSTSPAALIIPTVPSTCPGAMFLERNNGSDIYLHTITSLGVDCKYHLEANMPANCYADDFLQIRAYGINTYLPLYNINCMNGIVEAFRICKNGCTLSPGKWTMCLYTAYSSTAAGVVTIPACNARFGGIQVETYSGMSPYGIMDLFYGAGAAFGGTGSAPGATGFLSWTAAGGNLFTTAGGWGPSWDGGNSIPNSTQFGVYCSMIYPGSYGYYNGCRVFCAANYPCYFVNNSVGGCADGGTQQVTGGRNVSACINLGFGAGCYWIYNCGGYPTTNRWPGTPYVFTEGASGVLQGPWDNSCAISTDWRTGAGYVNGWPWHSIASGETSHSYGNLMYCSGLKPTFDVDVTIQFWVDNTNDTVISPTNVTYGVYNTGSTGQGTNLYRAADPGIGGVYSGGDIKQVNDWHVVGHLYAGNGNMWVGDHANPACSYCNGVAVGRHLRADTSPYFIVYANCRVFYN